MLMMKRMQRDTYATPGRGQSGSQRRTHAPAIHVGEEFDVTIEDLGHNGDGFVKIEGFTVFVKNTVKGEAVKIKIQKVLNTVAFAERQN
jgi:predicted RNA-binding protein with TRAM domain